MSSKFTLNAGLRWDPYFPVYGHDNRLTRFDLDRFNKGLHSTVFPLAPAGLVFVSANTQLDLSSSAVRAVIAAGRDPRYLMPEAARRIILARGSYARPGDEKE